MSRVTRYAENPARGVFVSKEIGEELYAELAPKIVQLRHGSNDPICLYIDSAGGSVFYAKRLLDLITSPRQDGFRPRLISISVGFAASAAADLLSLGDYAIAYPFSVIHHHGTRLQQEITVENIHTIEADLRETDEDFAVRLAARMFHRLIIRILQIRSEEAPGFLFHETVSNPQDFIDKLKAKLTEKRRNLIDQAVSRRARIGEILTFAGWKGTPNPIPSDKDLLKAILDFETSKNKPSDPVTTPQLDSTREAFFQIKEIGHQRYVTNLLQILQSQGEHFLSPAEKNEFDKIDPNDADERKSFLLEHVAPKLSPIWFLVVCLCRCLQHGENTI